LTFTEKLGILSDLLAMLTSSLSSPARTFSSFINNSGIGLVIGYDATAGTDALIGGR